MAVTENGSTINREVMVGVGGLSSQVASAHDSMGKVAVKDRASMLARQGEAMRMLVAHIARNPGSEQVLYQLQDVQPKKPVAKEVNPSIQA